LKLAIYSISTKTVSFVLLNQELNAIRERLQSKRYTNLHMILKKKEWLVNSDKSSAFKDIYLRTVRA
jgi:hypothetical protein